MALGKNGFKSIYVRMFTVTCIAVVPAFAGLCFYVYGQRGHLVETMLVALLLAHYIVAGRWLKRSGDSGMAISSGKLRLFNEIPVFLLLFVVWLALGKPF